MLKKMMAVLLSTVLIASISGCGQKEESSSGVIGGAENDASVKVEGMDSSDIKVTTVEPKQLEEFNVVLDWYPNAVHGFIYEAIEKGYYEQEGLKVNVQFPSNANDALSLTAAGKADAGIYYLQDMVMARANQNVPVKAIGTIVQKPLNIILSLAEKNITSSKDLIGKTIGYAGTELSEAHIKTILKDAGGSENDVSIIDVGFDLMSSMSTGRVDATIGCMVNHEVPAMKEEGFDVNYFFLNEYGVPDYYELVFVTGEDQLKDESKKDKLARFLKASQKGFEDMKKNPDETLQILLNNQSAENFPLKESVEKQSFDILLPLMETEEAPFLAQDPKVWQDNIDWLKQQGLLKNDIKAEDIVIDIVQ